MGLGFGSALHAVVPTRCSGALLTSARQPTAGGFYTRLCARLPCHTHGSRVIFLVAWCQRVLTSQCLHPNLGASRRGDGGLAWGGPRDRGFLVWLVLSASESVRVCTRVCVRMCVHVWGGREERRAQACLMYTP